jgi:hypothetical protein
MRVRPDSVFISSILHTIALLFFIHPALWYYGAPSDPAAVARFDAAVQRELYADHYFGVTCLAIILIGLLVVWTGYAKRSRPAWFVMFVIVWFWAFPVFIRDVVVRLARGEFMLTFPEFFYYVISGSGMITQVLRSVPMFLLMVIALALPMGKVLYSQEGKRTGSSTFQETCGLLADRHSSGCARVVLLVEGGRRLQNSNVANGCFTLPVTTAAFGSLQMP